MRVVTRRKQRAQPQRDAAILQRTMNRLRGYALIPKGVYRFDSHDEAHEWMMATIASTHERRSSTISSSSADR